MVVNLAKSLRLEGAEALFVGWVALGGGVLHILLSGTFHANVCL